MKSVILLLLSVTSVAFAESPMQPFHVQRDDGTSLSYYVWKENESRRDAILVLQGTGCEPVSTQPLYLAGGQRIAPGAAVILYDKYGAGGGDKPFVDGCSTAYWDRATLQQRVLDGLRVVAALRQTTWWNRHLTIFGGSEGGAVAAMLAPLVPETWAVIVYSSGIGVPIGNLITRALPPPVAAQAPSVVVAAHKNPTGDIRWAGLSYRWWADSVDLVPALDLVQTPAPVLLVHGGRDTGAPVSAAYAARDLLKAKGKANVTFREYARYDHHMLDKHGADHRAEVFHDIADWLEQYR